MADEISCVVLLSGGMDSTTLVALAKEKFNNVAALSVDYKQKHSRELESAKRVAAHFGLRHKIIDLSFFKDLVGYASALTSDATPVPHGHYADENMKITVVPGRNLVLLSLAASWAISLGYTHVAYAAHAGDHAIYPDCRPLFVAAVRKVFETFHYWPIEIWAPFLDITKKDILEIGFKLGVPYELTWTCYEGGAEPCGKCGSCVERIEAFSLIGRRDPLIVESRWAEIMKS